MTIANCMSQQCVETHPRKSVITRKLENGEKVVCPFCHMEGMYLESKSTSMHKGEGILISYRNGSRLIPQEDVAFLKYLEVE